MPESGELHQKIDSILKKVESIDNFMPWLVKPNSEKIKEELIKLFKKKKSAAKVFLAVDGEKNVTDISNSLGMAQPNVSREIATLIGLGLIDPANSSNATIYKKNKIDKVLGLSKVLQTIIETLPEPTNAVSETEEADENNETTSGNNNSIEDTANPKI